MSSLFGIVLVFECNHHHLHLVILFLEPFVSLSGIVKAIDGIYGVG